MITLPNGQDIPTEPDEFDPQVLKDELAKIVDVAEKLDRFWQLELREVPTPLQEKVRSIKLINLPTNSGIERVSGLLWQLYSIQNDIEALQRGESIYNSIAAANNLPAKNAESVSSAAPAGTVQQQTDPTINPAPAVPASSSSTIKTGTFQIAEPPAAKPVQPQKESDNSSKGSGTLVIPK